MTFSVPREERHAFAFEDASHDWAARGAKRRIHRELIDVAQSGHFVKAGAADNCEGDWVCHASPGRGDGSSVRAIDQLWRPENLEIERTALTRRTQRARRFESRGNTLPTDFVFFVSFVLTDWARIGRADDSGFCDEGGNELCRRDIERRVVSVDPFRCPTLLPEAADF